MHQLHREILKLKYGQIHHWQIAHIMVGKRQGNKMNGGASKPAECRGP